MADLVILDRLILARIPAGLEIFRDRLERSERIPGARCRLDVSNRPTVDREVSLAPRGGIDHQTIAAGIAVKCWTVD
ncbi:hypothetical protein [Bradyrhizobium sp. 141]|uniref:hypothetical protein n=1 Tax=Bradyrhizobium sp. 141 TaxID=2782617 RepID=UPI001FF75B97|nr:hypothetical protein [Bradyrhizobium sp. 141]MCK1717869.1 hypothetical protein [Bradyrhizobium sp. 141]